MLTDLQMHDISAAIKARHKAGEFTNRTQRAEAMIELAKAAGLHRDEPLAAMLWLYLHLSQKVDAGEAPAAAAGAILDAATVWYRQQMALAASKKTSAPTKDAPTPATFGTTADETGPLH